MDGAGPIVADAAGTTTPAAPGWRSYLPWAGAGAAALGGAALVWFLIEPGQPAIASETRSVEDQWRDSMARLGVRAVYPPTEDMHVGDLWAVVVSPEADPADLPLGLPSRAVRVGYLPLDDKLRAAARRRAALGAFGGPEAAQRGTPAGAPDAAGPIGLSLVMFPAVQDRRSTEIQAEGGSWLGLFQGTRRATLVQEISVPQAFGYGVAVAEATEELLLWCHNEPVRCSQSYLERVVRYGLGADVLESAQPGAPAPRVELRLISYVFLANEIVMQQTVEGSVGGGARLGQPAEAGRGQTPGATAGLNESAHRGVVVRNVFPRPVAIGFRAVAIRPLAEGGGS